MTSRSKPAANEWRVTVWAEWVAAGPDRDERAARLERVPAVSRAAVRQEVIWWFQRISVDKASAPAA